MFDDIINNNLNNMPKFMKDFHIELQKREKPDFDMLKKKEYIWIWLLWFDYNSFHNQTREKNDNRFLSHTKSNIRDSFCWVAEHFAELDLGGNMAWYGVALDVLKLMNNKKWNPEVEKRYMANYIIKDTYRRW